MGGTFVLAITAFLSEFEGAGVEALTLSLRGRSLGVPALAALTSRMRAGSESFEKDLSGAMRGEIVVFELFGVVPVFRVLFAAV